MAISSQLSDKIDDFNLTLSNYRKILDLKGLQLSDSDIEKLYKGVLEQYSEYSQAHPVLVTNFDPLKVYAWAPFVLSEVIGDKCSKEEHELLFVASATCMCDFLYRTGTQINSKWVAKLIVIARASFDAAKEKVSIARVGYYSGFRSAKETAIIRGLAGPAKILDH